MGARSNGRRYPESRRILRPNAEHALARDIPEHHVWAYCPECNSEVFMWQDFCQSCFFVCDRCERLNPDSQRSRHLFGIGGTPMCLQCESQTMGEY